MVAGFVLPDYPHTTRWLDEEERAFASWRLLADVNEADAQYSNSVWTGVKLALKDYRLYIFVLLQHISLLSQTFQYFFPSIVGTLGYGPINTLWLTAPVWVRARRRQRRPPFAALLTRIFSDLWLISRQNHISLQPSCCQSA